LFAALALRLADSDSSQAHSTALPRFHVIGIITNARRNCKSSRNARRNLKKRLCFYIAWCYNSRVKK
jgi:hypothetical protein